MKRCSRCKEVKESPLFVKDNSSIDGLAKVCKSCKNLFYFNNKSRILEKRRKHLDENRDEINRSVRDRNKTKHGKIMLMLSHIQQRCNNPKIKCYHRYGGRGIKNLITYQEIEILWDRDNADSFTIPSIDRIDNDGDYVFNNCQIMEKWKNSSKEMQKRPVTQMDMNGNVVKEWDSLSDAMRSGFMRQNIYHCCKGKRPSHKGFKWCYKQT